MKSHLRQKKVAVQQVSREKERVFKGLSQLFASCGFKVRREELKRGPGWTVSSGSCRKMEEKLVFVDRRSPIDDQIAFLVQAFLQEGFAIENCDLSEISEELRPGLLSLLGAELNQV